MRNWLGVLTCVAVLITGGCEPKRISQSEPSLEKRIVRGKIVKEFPNQGFVTLYRLRKGAWQLIDTVRLQPSGRFYADFQTDQVEICLLDFFGRQQIEFVVAEPDVYCQVQYPSSVEFKNSEENQYYRLFIELNAQNIAQKKRLVQQGKLLEYQQALSQPVKVFVSQHAQSFAALQALDLLSPSQHHHFIQEHLEKYSELYQRTELWQMLSQKVQPYSTLQVGSVAPSFWVANTDSTINLQTLASQQKSSILLHVWASWCFQCEQSLRQTSEWARYTSQKGTSIFMLHVSLDTQPDTWITQIAQNDNTLEHHLIDTSGWDADVVKKYSIESLPFLCLVDTAGTISRYNFQADSLALFIP